MSWLSPTDYERALTDNARHNWPEILELATYTALCPRIEPLLLRNMRLKFLPGSEPELESRLWFCPLISSRSVGDVVLHQGTARLLAEDLMNQDVFGTVWELTQNWTVHWDKLDRHEQQLRYAALINDHQSIQRGLQDILKLIVKSNKNKDDEYSSLNLARWTKKTLPAIADETHTSKEISWLSQFSATALGATANWTKLSSPSPMPAWLSEALPKAKASVAEGKIDLQLRYDSNKGNQVLECLQATDTEKTLLLPTPLPAKLYIQCENQSSGDWEVITVGSRIKIPHISHRIELCTIDGQRYELLAEFDEVPLTASNNKAPEIFLAYVDEDRETADKIADQLKQQKIDVTLILEESGKTTFESKPDSNSRLLRLWTPAAQLQWSKVNQDDMQTHVNSLLLRMDQAPLPTGTNPAQIIDWEATENHVQKIYDWLQKSEKLVVAETAKLPKIESGAVYLSFSSVDQDKVRNIKQTLDQAGLDVWFDDQDLDYGSNWETEIQRNINQCSIFLPCISQKAAQVVKGVFRLEWKLAIKANQKMVESRRFIQPIVLDDCPEHTGGIPAEFWDKQYTRLQDGKLSEDFVGQLVVLMRKLQLRMPKNKTDTLLKELENPETKPRRRLEIGDILAEMGDPRRGVGVKEYEIIEYSPEIQELLDELNNISTEPPRRLEIGDQLAELGDPRAGVGPDENGLPDIDWLEIPAGEFIYGIEFSRETLELENFFISRHLITNSQFQAFINEGGYDDERWWQDLIKPKSEKPSWPQPNRPRETVSWYEAVAFTRWLSAQLGYTISLPTGQQWEKATRGKDGRKFPWGKKYKAGFANINETIGRPGGHWNLEQTTAVGLYPQGISPYRVADLTGNVKEWCSSKRGSITNGDDSLVRGSSWNNIPLDASFSEAQYLSTDFRNDLIGFRVVCSSPFTDH